MQKCVTLNKAMAHNQLLTYLITFTNLARKIYVYERTAHKETALLSRMVM